MLSERLRVRREVRDDRHGGTDTSRLEDRSSIVTLGNIGSFGGRGKSTVGKKVKSFAGRERKCKRDHL